MNAPTRTYLGLGLAQRAIWADMRLRGDSSAYLLGRVFTFHGEIDPALARQALRVTMGRHEAMRLRVDPLEPRQWVEVGGVTPFRLSDFSEDADPDAAAAAHFDAVRAQGFAIDAAPLVRIELAKLGAQRWRLLFLCHHLVFDGLSFELVQQQWLAAYRALAGEESAEAEPRRSTWADVVAADAAYEQSPRHRDDLAYWRTRLADAPAPLFAPRAEPEDGPRPEPVQLDAETLGRLEAAAARAGATWQQALVYLFALALARRFGREDVVVGMALHRRDASTRHVVGCLAGLMAARAGAKPADTLANALAAFAAQLTADLAHARAPLDAVAREIGAREGLVEAAITIVPTLMDSAPTFGGRHIEGERLRAEERTPLALYVQERPARAGLGLEFAYRRDFVSGAEARHILGVTLDLLRAFVDGAAPRIGDLSGLTSQEARDLAVWSAGADMATPAEDVATLFERVAAAQPQALAVVSDAGALTYAELDAAADRLAARLLEQGVAPGEAVGVAMPRALASPAAILGVMKAGAVYLPLDPDNPAERLAGMIEDAGAQLILTAPDIAPRLPPGLATIPFEGEWPLAGEAAARPARALTPASRAYIVFTSGSTGRPKGVAVSQGALVNLAYARRAHDPLGPGDRVLAAISIGFDVSLGQLLTPLLSGATVVVQGDLRGRAAGAFWDFVARHGVSHVNSVPSFFASVLDAAPEQTSLKRLMLGGEPLTGALALRLKQKLGVPVFNMYGPTEACIDATCYEAPDGAEGVAVLPIGRPLPNYRAYVLDAALQLAAPGVEGELCLGGPSLAEGYVGAPELTAARFVETPLGRLYRTGDRAAWDEDGHLRFLGRADNQVKIRGHRVEIGEIETALLALPGVMQAAVVARADARGETRLIGYVVGEADPAALREALPRRLPLHMLPSALMKLDALPLTLNGKLDAAALPAPDAPAPETLTPPQGATELWLAQAFTQLFPGAAIGRESHFFDLGGHSLMATQLATKLRAARGLELPLRALFDAPRLQDLARAVDALAPEAALPPLAPQPRPARPPLTPAQERLWFLAQLDPASAAYNIPVALRVEGRLDAGALARALEKLIARHETLRTRFPAEAGLPYQQIGSEGALDFAVLDVADAETIRATVAREALRPFDLARGPLMRARLLRAQTDVLLIVVHHIVADGASMLVLLDELAALYAGAEPPALAIQFADYALWRRSSAFNATDSASLAYWREALADAPEALDLPADWPRPARASGRGDSVALDLGADLTNKVRAFARARNLTPFMVLAAAWAATLARLSGEDDIVIGAPLANRSTPETDGLIAFLVNTAPLRARFGDAPDFVTLTARMRESALGAQAHGDFPFERLVAALAPERSLARNPVFQAMFALQPDLPAAFAFGQVEAKPIPLLENVAKFDLTLNLTDATRGYSGALTYATDLFRRETAERMAQVFAAFLSAALGAPATPFDRLPLLAGTGDGRQAEGDALGERPPQPALGHLLPQGEKAHERQAQRSFVPASIPALFAAHAAQQPDAPAAIFAGHRLSYAELDAETNRLARALIARGAQGRPVAVMLARSEKLVVAALGVMKAGAIYLPLDPAAPDARAAAMLADAAPAVFLGDASTAARAGGWPYLDIADPGESAAALDTAIEPGATAYLLYTSGSTGTPKGVAVSHAALATLADARLVHDPIGPGDRVLATMSVGFDVSLGQLVTPLLSGATVVVAPPLAGVSSAEFWALMAEQGITHVNSGPAFLDAVLETAPPPQLPLKRLMLGGEAFPAALARKIAAALPGVEIFNMYGPTEACIDATAYRFRGDETGAVLPIGRALPHYRVAVLDAGLNPLPRGVPGEICIGGPALAEGYWNRPEETAARFVTGPGGERLYRTGDRARVNADGDIEFLGRLDAQVKIRGHRIEPEEIAAVLRRAPGVVQAAVAATARGRERALVAYVAPAGDAAALRALCEASLPAYMVPAAFVFAPSLPMTLNGKLDVKALPAPEFVEETRAPTPPRDETDATLVEIWRALLELETLGIDDNFFRLGGHSLLAVRLVAAVEARLGVNLPIAEVYRSPTVRALADAIRSGEATKRRGPLVKLGDGPGRPVFALHPMGGGAFGYLGLAEALAGRRPVYGVQASGLEAGETLAATLDEMATAYLDAIMQVQPHGPYALLGHSFGGLVAFELARRLEERGEVVERLVVCDTNAPGERWTPEQARQGGQGIFRREERRAGRADAPIDPEREQRVIDIVANHMRLAESYDPPQIKTPMNYVVARRQGLPLDGRRAFWESRSETPLPTPEIGCEHNAVIDRENAVWFAQFFD